MRIEKEKRKVKITCQDGSAVEGFMHINPGERILDFMNNAHENFIAITDAKFYSSKEIQSFKLISQSLNKKNFIILNKSAVKWIEEA
jgi:hypothetical protein